MNLKPGEPVQIGYCTVTLGQVLADGSVEIMVDDPHAAKIPDPKIAVENARSDKIDKICRELGRHGRELAPA